MSTQANCHLHFLIAREAHIAVIFRRGPAKRVQIIKWNTDTDTFETGQWFYGRIHEHHCDLSPSGEKLLYVASKYRFSTHDPDFGYSWTAISRPPYLTALALWPTISPGFGGGIFDHEKIVRIWYLYKHIEPHADFVPPPDFNYSTMLALRPEDKLGKSPEKEHPYTPSVITHVTGIDIKLGYRLNRDGWIVTQEWDGEYLISNREAACMAGDLELASTLPNDGKVSGYVTRKPEIREKAQTDGTSRLRMYQSIDKFDHKITFGIFIRSTNVEQKLDGAEWADFDHSGRLVFAAYGKLFAGDLQNGELVTRELADFNGHKPQPVVAPDWATKW